VALIAALAYALYFNIAEPINFKAEKDKRESAVVAQLEKIRTCQEIYRDITGEFAPTFDTLVQVLSTDSIPFRQVLEDPDFPGDPEKFIVNVLYSSASDSLSAMGISLNNLSGVPFSNDAKFSITADTMTYQKTNVWVTQVMTKYKEFMGEFADQKYMKYDDTYNPGTDIGFGSLNSPNLEGTWK